MTKRKHRNDEAFFRRVKAEFPELFEAKLTVELDDTRIASNPDKPRVIARHRKKTKTNTNRKH
jgi:predicted RNA-binding protein